MTYCSLIDLFGASLGLLAASFFCWGSATLTCKQANLLSGACPSGNPHVAVFYRILKIDYLTGSIFLVLAFVIQGLAKFEPLSCESHQVSNCILVVFGIGVLLIALVAWIVKIRIVNIIKDELGL